MQYSCVVVVGCTGCRLAAFGRPQLLARESGLAPPHPRSSTDRVFLRDSGLCLLRPGISTTAIHYLQPPSLTAVTGQGCRVSLGCLLGTRDPIPGIENSWRTYNLVPRACSCSSNLQANEICLLGGHGRGKGCVWELCRAHD